MKRPFVSLSIAFIFLILATSGLFLVFAPHLDWVIITHVVFGVLFLGGAIIHFLSNRTALVRYLQHPLRWVIPISVFFLVVLVSLGVRPFDNLAVAYARFQAGQHQDIGTSGAEEYVLTGGGPMSLEIRAGEHFWFPQIAIWAEDSSGNYLETLFTTYSTAKGVFYGGRTKSNFKTFDTARDAMGHGMRRVDALPHWSHKRGIRQPDGLHAPSPEDPLVDAISGATPSGSFMVKNTRFSNKTYRIMLEANVAFDDNKYFSEFDYPDDSLYHSGTGLLGQPSVIYQTKVSAHSTKKHYLMDYLGHTMPSKGGELFADQEGLTTALEIIDLALVHLE